MINKSPLVPLFQRGDKRRSLFKGESTRMCEENEK
jgi:hypothetical protein